MIGFGKFGKRRDLEIIRHPRMVDLVLDITSLEDERLLLVDPTREGFFDKVLNSKVDFPFANDYIEAIREVQEAEIRPFWRPVMDPSFDGKKIIYKKGEEPVRNPSIEWLRYALAEMPAVEGKNWYLGSEYHYYADEVDLINKLVDDKGYDIEDAMRMVVYQSKELGHYAESVDAKDEFERTGSREVCGRYDLNNTRKILRCTNNNGYWLAASNYRCKGDSTSNSLAHLEYTESFRFAGDSVWWLMVE